MAAAASPLCASADFACVWSFVEAVERGALSHAMPANMPQLSEHLEAGDQVTPYLRELYCKLLRRAFRSFRPLAWERALVRFLVERGRREEAREIEMLGVRRATPKVRLAALRSLLEHQFVCNAKFKSAVNKIDAAELRRKPLGRDAKGRVYWLHTDARANVRLYVEDQDEETWQLIASDRAGLVEVIAALKDGKSPFEPSAEPLINEDSNSVGSPVHAPDADVCQKKIPTKVDVDMEDDTIIDTIENRNETASEHDSDEEIEEKVMIVTGEGDGADCESRPVHFFSEEVEEEVMYFYGEGSGFECSTGNPNPGSDAKGRDEGESSDRTADDAERTRAPLPVTKRILQNVPEDSEDSSAGGASCDAESLRRPVLNETNLSIDEPHTSSRVCADRDSSNDVDNNCDSLVKVHIESSSELSDSNCDNTNCEGAVDIKNVAKSSDGSSGISSDAGESVECNFFHVPEENSTHLVKDDENDTAAIQSTGLVEDNVHVLNAYSSSSNDRQHCTASEPMNSEVELKITTENAKNMTESEARAEIDGVQAGPTPESSILEHGAASGNPVDVFDEGQDCKKGHEVISEKENEKCYRPQTGNGDPSNLEIEKNLDSELDNKETSTCTLDEVKSTDVLTKEKPECGMADTNVEKSNNTLNDISVSISENITFSTGDGDSSVLAGEKLQDQKLSSPHSEITKREIDVEVFKDESASTKKITEVKIDTEVVIDEPDSITIMTEDGVPKTLSDDENAKKLSEFEEQCAVNPNVYIETISEEVVTVSNKPVCNIVDMQSETVSIVNLTSAAEILPSDNINTHSKLVSNELISATDKFSSDNFDGEFKSVDNRTLSFVDNQDCEKLEVNVHAESTNSTVFLEVGKSENDRVDAKSESASDFIDAQDESISNSANSNFDKPENEGIDAQSESVGDVVVKAESVGNTATSDIETSENKELDVESEVVGDLVDVQVESFSNTITSKIEKSNSEEVNANSESVGDIADEKAESIGNTATSDIETSENNEFDVESESVSDLVDVQTESINNTITSEIEKSKSEEVNAKSESVSDIVDEKAESIGNTATSDIEKSENEEFDVESESVGDLVAVQVESFSNTITSEIENPKSEEGNAQSESVSNIVDVKSESISITATSDIEKSENEVESESASGLVDVQAESTSNTITSEIEKSKSEEVDALSKLVCDKVDTQFISVSDKIQLELTIDPCTSVLNKLSGDVIIQSASVINKMISENTKEGGEVISPELVDDKVYSVTKKLDNDEVDVQPELTNNESISPTEELSTVVNVQSELVSTDIITPTETLTNDKVKNQFESIEDQMISTVIDKTDNEVIDGKPKLTDDQLYSMTEIVSSETGNVQLESVKDEMSRVAEKSDVDGVIAQFESVSNDALSVPKKLCADNIRFDSNNDQTVLAIDKSKNEVIEDESVSVNYPNNPSTEKVKNDPVTKQSEFISNELISEITEAEGNIVIAQVEFVNDEVLTMTDKQDNKIVDTKFDSIDNQTHPLAENVSPGLLEVQSEPISISKIPEKSLVEENSESISCEISPSSPRNDTVKMESKLIEGQMITLNDTSNSEIICAASHSVVDNNVTENIDSKQLEAQYVPVNDQTMLIADKLEKESVKTKSKIGDNESFSQTLKPNCEILNFQSKSINNETVRPTGKESLKNEVEKSDIEIVNLQTESVQFEIISAFEKQDTINAAKEIDKTDDDICNVQIEKAENIINKGEKIAVDDIVEAPESKRNQDYLKNVENTFQPMRDDSVLISGNVCNIDVASTSKECQENVSNTQQESEKGELYSSNDVNHASDLSVKKGNEAIIPVHNNSENKMQSNISEIEDKKLIEISKRKETNALEIPFENKSLLGQNSSNQNIDLPLITPKYEQNVDEQTENKKSEIAFNTEIAESEFITHTKKNQFHSKPLLESVDEIISGTKTDSSTSNLHLISDKIEEPTTVECVTNVIENEFVKVDKMEPNANIRLSKLTKDDEDALKSDDKNDRLESNQSLVVTGNSEVETDSKLFVPFDNSLKKTQHMNENTIEVMDTNKEFVSNTVNVEGDKYDLKVNVVDSNLGSETKCVENQIDNITDRTGDDNHVKIDNTGILSKNIENVESHRVAVANELITKSSVDLVHEIKTNSTDSILRSPENIKRDMSILDENTVLASKSLGKHKVDSPDSELSHLDISNETSEPKKIKLECETDSYIEKGPGLSGLELKEEETIECPEKIDSPDEFVAFKNEVDFKNDDLPLDVSKTEEGQISKKSMEVSNKVSTDTPKASNDDTKNKTTKDEIVSPRVTRKSSRLDKSSDNIDDKPKPLDPLVESNDNKQGVRTRRTDMNKNTKVPESTKDYKDEEIVTPKITKKTEPKLESSNVTSLTKSNNRKRGRDESESVSEAENQDIVQNKKLKMRQKISNPILRKKVEDKKDTQNLSSDEEPELVSTTESKPVKGKKGAKKKVTISKKAWTHKQKLSKADGTPTESSLTETPDYPPIRQSRRIAQLKIKEEAQRRLMEEMALKEMKAQHKKKIGKTKDQDWKHSESEHSSEEPVSKKVKGKHKKKEKWQKKLGWHSSSGGNDTDTEPGEEPEDDFDDPDVEEDILASKSDHEFSPESDVDGADSAPIRRARTLKKEDDENIQDVDGGCVHCGKSDHPEWILLCDSCDGGWHASCLKPVLFLVPEGEWFCPPCNHKSLIHALETALETHDKQVELVAIEDLKCKKSDSESLDKMENSDAEEEFDKSDESDKTSSESCTSDSSSSDGEKVYRLRERRQLPVSYRFKEYDQLISSAIKEEYKEDDNSGAGNQGRGKDISTIIEADKEEKKAILQAELEASGRDSETVASLKKRITEVRPRRRPRKLNSLEVVSDDCDDNSDEDFKETGWSSSSSEAISSANLDESNSGSSSSDSSAPLKRCLRPSRAKAKKSKQKSPIRKKRARILDSTSESDDSMELLSEKKKKTKVEGSPEKKSKKRKKEKTADGDVDGTKVRVKIKYGGLSDSSRSSHDWSPAHRTRQRKYNYMELPNTESEDEAHKPSGKHMDSSDEYKGESGSSDSDSSYGKGRGKKDPDGSPVKEEGETEEGKTDQPTPKKSKKGAKFGTPKGSKKKNSKTAAISNQIKGIPILQEDPSLQGATESGKVMIVGNAEGVPAPVLIKPLTPLQIEREKKRREKLEEKEKRKEERLKKKEEKLQLKEQKAKEREEKKNLRTCIPISQNMYGVSAPIPIRYAANFPRGITPPQPPYSDQQPNMIRNAMTPLPTPVRIHNPNVGPHIQPQPIMINQPMPPKEGMHLDGRSPAFSFRPQIENPTPPPPPPHLKQELPDKDERSAFEEQKSVPLTIENRTMLPTDIRKSFPIGPGPPLPIGHPGQSSFPIHRGISPSMENSSHIIRPMGPAYAYDNKMHNVRENLLRPSIKPVNEIVPSNGIPIMNPGSEHRTLPSTLQPKSEHEDPSPYMPGHEQGTPKRRGRGLGKKTLARQAAAAAALTPTSEGGSPSPSNSPLLEGTLTVAGAPQPFRPSVDPPSVITRMPHMMPPPYRGSAPYNNSMYGAHRPLGNLPAEGVYRGHPPPHLLDSTSTGRPIPMTVPERSSPQNPYSPYQPPYYPPAGTPPQMAPYPSPHGRFPPHMSMPPFRRSPTTRDNPLDSSDVEEKAKSIVPPEQPKPEIKQEPVNIKQSSSPTKELDDSPATSENKNEESSEDQPSNFSSGSTSKAIHPRLKYTDAKTSRERMIVTSSARFLQGPYAPSPYAPYAPYQQAPDVPYLNAPHHPGVHPAPPMHRPGYPPPHHPPPAPLHPPPAPLHTQLHPRPILAPVPTAAERVGNDESAGPQPVVAGGSGQGEDTTSEFGGLVSYFSSQREDDIDT